MTRKALSRGLIFSPPPGHSPPSVPFWIRSQLPHFLLHFSSTNWYIKIPWGRLGGEVREMDIRQERHIRNVRFVVAVAATTLGLMAAMGLI